MRIPLVVPKGARFYGYCGQCSQLSEPVLYGGQLVLLRLTLVFVVLLLALPLVAYSAPILLLPNITGDPGSTVWVPISIEHAVDLFAFQFSIQFDPRVVLASAALEGPFLSQGGLYPTFFVPGTVDNLAGNIRFIANTLLGSVVGATGNGVLALVPFTVQPGFSPLTLSDVLLLDSSLAEISATSVAGSISGVPEPSSISLLGLGIAGILWRKRRQHPSSERWH
jgi:hypothetical protein